MAGPNGPAVVAPVGPAMSGEPGSAILGGALERRAGACLVVSRTYPAAWRHGSLTVEASARGLDDGLTILAGRDRSAWQGRAGHATIFFDIETTGLSGGAGTLVFLVGLGWFGPEGFRTRQYLLAGLGGERELLAAVASELDAASVIVTFNGKSFDMPVMDTRWLFHRMRSPAAGLMHVDLLHPARRLWPGDGCALADVERSVLRVWRRGDVSGAEVPARYVAYLRTGELELLTPVMEHNRLDLLSLAVATSRTRSPHAPRRCAVGPFFCAGSGSSPQPPAHGTPC
jgi:uncharacterized protein YprB with RNaseH-like and TPR domain